MIKTIVLAVLLMISAAQAHEWYPDNCCGGKDCEPLPIEAFTETEGGWQISVCSATREKICVKGFVPHGKEQMSEDGKFHVCFNESRIICFFAPVNT